MSFLLKSLSSPRSYILATQTALVVATLTGRSMSTSTSTNTTWPVRAYVPRHQSWPYADADFARHDSSADTRFYNEARLVTHIDDAAIATLGQYYDSVLPRKGRLLDFCSSWISHYPRSVSEAAQSGDLHIIGMGMNKEELAANPVLRADSRLTTDLNVEPDIHKALSGAQLISTDNNDSNNKLTASTCVVSIDYLTNPLKVLESLRRATAPGGTVHLAISNRCFPTKVVSRWLRISEEERLQMVGDYLHFSGWKKIEIVELSDGSVEENGGGGNNEGNASQGLASLMRFVGVGMSRDPLWIVRATRQD